MGLGELKDESGELSVKAGDKVTAYVVSDNAGETVLTGVSFTKCRVRTLLIP